MKTYPTKWYRVEQRGCGANGGETCQRLHLPIERQEVAPGKVKTRHIYPKAEVFAALEAQTHKQVDTAREGRQWWATLMNGSRADNEMRRVFGATEREALQNLADRMRVKLP